MYLEEIIRHFPNFFSKFNMILGVVVASNRCTLFCLAKLTCLFLLSFFYGPIVCRTQGVGRIAAALGKLNCWLIALCMNGIDYHTLCIVGFSLGNGSVFVLGMNDAVFEE